MRGFLLADEYLWTNRLIYLQGHFRHSWSILFVTEAVYLLTMLDHKIRFVVLLEIQDGEWWWWNTTSSEPKGKLEKIKSSFKRFICQYKSRENLLGCVETSKYASELSSQSHLHLFLFKIFLLGRILIYHLLNVLSNLWCFFWGLGFRL